MKWKESRLDANVSQVFLAQHPPDFAERLLKKEIDVVLFLTGVGVCAMLEIVDTKYECEIFLTALRATRIVTRGPKPEAALRELKVKSIATAPEPSTWHEVLATMDRAFGEELKSLRVAVQEVRCLQP
jgi:uroporphyrinogen-III synthase